MGRFFEEYGNLIISTLISIFVIAMLFIVLNANTLLGLKTEVSGNIKCEMPDYPYSFEVESGEIEGNNFDWKTYVSASDSENNSLLDHIVVSGNVNTKKSGAYLLGYTLYYRGYAQTKYGLYTVKYDPQIPTLIFSTKDYDTEDYVFTWPICKVENYDSGTTWQFIIDNLEEYYYVGSPYVVIENIDDGEVTRILESLYIDKDGSINEEWHSLVIENEDGTWNNATSVTSSDTLDGDKTYVWIV